MYSTTSPKTPFYVYNKLELDKATEITIYQLYQPLVGSLAINLYHSLNYLSKNSPLKSDYQPLYQLQEYLEMNLPDIFTALHKLEAVNLVKTYVEKNQMLGETVTFKLILPLGTKDFFETFLLSGLLLEKVGEVRFNELVKQTAPLPKLDLSKAKEVSANFFDVFHVNAERVINPPETLTTAAEMVQGDNPAAPSKPQTKPAEELIDWDFLTAQFAAYHIEPAEVLEHQQEISDLMRFFDLSELEFVNQVKVTLTPGVAKLDFKQIKNNFMRDNQVTQQKATIKPEALAKVKNIMGQLSADDQVKLAEMVKMPPVKYLQNLRNQTGGFVSATENSIIYQLKQRGLEDELINALTYVVLQNNSMLTKSYVETIANDWLQAGVTTAAHALSYTKERQQKRPKRNYRKGGAPAKKEVATDWSKVTPQNVSPQTKDSDGELDDLLAQLKDDE